MVLGPFVCACDNFKGNENIFMKAFIWVGPYRVYPLNFYFFPDFSMISP